MALRGCLRLLTLKALAGGPKSGYGLMSFVEEKVGGRPSSGSMYPLLESLQEEQLISTKKASRGAQYALTRKGRQRLKVIEKKRDEIMQNFLDGMRTIEALTGEDMHFPKQVVQSLKRGEVPFKEANPEWEELRARVFWLWQSGRMKAKRADVKKILKRTNQELKKV